MYTRMHSHSKYNNYLTRSLQRSQARPVKQVVKSLNTKLNYRMQKNPGEWESFISLMVSCTNIMVTVAPRSSKIV